MSSEDCDYSVLLLLTPGVLKGDDTLADLEKALKQDKEDQRDRIVAVCDESWDFRGSEAMEAPSDVRACLNSHEALIFRPPTDSDSGDCHEHPAMMKQLLQKLRMQRVKD